MASVSAPTMPMALADIMIGGAILPSLLHQDPRYFYQGQRHKEVAHTPRPRSADSSAGEITDGRQLNYSSLGGRPGLRQLSRTLYYPASNRGPGLVFRAMPFSAPASACSAVWCKSSSCTSSRPKPKIRTSRGGHGKAAQDAAQAIRMNSNRGSWCPQGSGGLCQHDATNP